MRPAYPGAVLCIGDSLTAASYPTVLSWLTRADVHNEGVGGQTSREIAARFKPIHGMNVLWMGNNNYAEPDRIVSDIAACAERVRSVGGEFRVLSLVNGEFPGRMKGGVGYHAILGCNRRLKAAYGRQFVDVRAALNAVADAGVGDVIPAALRVDQIHLNRRGYVTVARVVAASF